MWVPAEQWQAGAVPKGRRLDLVATVLPYWRATDDTKDFGLTEVVLAMKCLNAPYCEHRADCNPMVCDSFVPVAPTDNPAEEGGESS